MKFRTKKEEIEEKYRDVIRLIAITNDVDVDVAYDMFHANVTEGGTYPYFNVEEAQKDFAELKEIAGNVVNQ